MMFRKMRIHVSLRLLLLGIATLCVFLSIVSADIYRNREQVRVAQSLDEKGVEIKHYEPPNSTLASAVGYCLREKSPYVPVPTSVRVRKRQSFDDSMFVQVCKLSQIKTLDIANTS